MSDVESEPDLGLDLDLDAILDREAPKRLIRFVEYYTPLIRLDAPTGPHQGAESGLVHWPLSPTPRCLRRFGKLPNMMSDPQSD